MLPFYSIAVVLNPFEIEHPEIFLSVVIGFVLLLALVLRVPIPFLSVPHYRFAEAVAFLAPRVRRATVLVFGNIWSEPLAAEFNKLGLGERRTRGASWPQNHRAMRSCSAMPVVDGDPRSSPAGVPTKTWTSWTRLVGTESRR